MRQTLCLGNQARNGSMDLLAQSRVVSGPQPAGGRGFIAGVAIAPGRSAEQVVWSMRDAF
jgi:hypothetical protein